ncbi:MAG: methionine synthase [Candidatus Omnitrophica bacterium]|nr:methionine synthase [Candidatus Omnitrophota bacterium]MDD5237013.1 methionine synthase [Candidatus Omnitrophota bacterium]MDD5610289.1 methionine synthase [Candidatus Omnitrophota bacterium]
MSQLKGSATLIGSFPYKDADEALDLIFQYAPAIPSWPQLPRRDAKEGMVAQYSEGLPCLKMSGKGLYLDESDKEANLEAFYAAVIDKDIQKFEISEDYSQGLWRFYQRLENSDLSKIKYIKCHVTGPFTFAAGINDASGRPILHDAVFMQAVIKGLSMKALWQIELFRKFKKEIILFFDEPYLSCFGSGFTPINRENVVAGLKDLTSTVKSKDVLLGIHCCGNTDWSMFTDVEGIDIINFDAFEFLEKVTLYAQDIGKFLARDGALCWGIVPTQEFSDKISKKMLIDKIKSGIDTFKNKGVKETLLLERILVSPACGLGSLEPAKIEPILKLLAQISQDLR